MQEYQDDSITDHDTKIVMNVLMIIVKNIYDWSVADICQSIV